LFFAVPPPLKEKNGMSMNLSSRGEREREREREREGGRARIAIIGQHISLLSNYLP
jgi:hypothetical protein